jgi:aspartate aminotransferase
VNLGERGTSLVSSGTGDVLFGPAAGVGTAVDLRTFDASFFDEHGVSPSSISSHDLLQYGATPGHPRLRALVGDLAGMQSNEIVISDGASQAILMVVSAVADPGDTILIPTPGFSAYERIIRTVGCTPKLYRNDQIDGLFREGTSGNVPRVVIVNSPNNPTGEIVDDHEIANLIRRAASCAAFVLIDDAYSWFEYIKSITRFVSVERKSGFASNFACVGSLGKYICLQGLRLGFVAARDADLVRCVVELKRHLAQSSCPISEAIAIERLSERSLPTIHERVRASIRTRRRQFASIARQHGAQVAENGEGYFAFAHRAKELTQTGLIGISGQVFGAPADSMRFCLGVSSTKWNDTLAR